MITDDFESFEKRKKPSELDILFSNNKDEDIPSNSMKLNYKCKKGTKDPDTNECEEKDKNKADRYGYKELNNLGKKLKNEEITIDEFENACNKFPQTLTFRNSVRDVGTWATGLGGWFVDTSFSEELDEEIVGHKNVPIPKKYEDEDPKNMRPDKVIADKVKDVVGEIKSVEGKAYARIREVFAPKSSIEYISNMLEQNNIKIDLLDVSDMIGMIGGQGMTLANINGSDPSNVSFKVNGLFISNEIFDKNYYDKVVKHRDVYKKEHGKLAVLSSDATDEKSLSKMVIDHEIGHIMLYKYRYIKMKDGIIDINSENIQSDPEWKEIAKMAWQNGFESTTHGDSSSEELFAEAYCANENDRKEYFTDEMNDFVEKVKITVREK